MQDDTHHITNLYLDRTTPIIQAVFGRYVRDIIDCYNGHVFMVLNNRIYVEWDEVRLALIRVASDLGLLTATRHDSPPPHEDLWQSLPTVTVLRVLARHFGTDDDAELKAYIEHNPFFGRAPIESLLLIAWCLNDGHNLFAARDIRHLEYNGLRVPWPHTKAPSTAGKHDGAPTPSLKWRLVRALYTALSRLDVDMVINAFEEEFYSLIATLADRGMRAHVRRLISQTGRDA